MRPPLRPLLALLQFVAVLAVVAALPVQAQQLPLPTGVAWDITTELGVAEPAQHPGELARYRVPVLPPLGEAREGDLLRIALPGGSRAFVVRRTTEHFPGTRSISAVAADGSGEVAALTLAPDGPLGVLTAGDALYHLFPGEGGGVLAQMDPHALDHLACGTDEHDHPEPPVPGTAARGVTGPAGAPPSALAMTEGVGDPVTIDILVLYTRAAETWAALSQFGSIEGVIAQAFNLSQTALDNSQTGLTLRLVHARRTDYDESLPPPEGQEGGPSVWHLYRLTASASFPPPGTPWGPSAQGYLPEAHTLRDEFGADLVALFADISDVGGIAWLLGTIGGRPELGFSVNRVQQMANSYTLVHEFGHNLGNVHGRDQPTNVAGPAGGIFPYATGWRWRGDDGWFYNSVMSYGQPGDTRVPFFSNPAVLYEGQPTGAVAGPFAPADAARTIRETKRTVAAYRLPRVAPPAAALAGGITVELPVGVEAIRTFPLANTGLTDLLWEVDVTPLPAARPPSPQGDASFSASGLTLDPAEAAAAFGAASLSPGAVENAGSDLLVIYATDFESTDGFSAGVHLHEGGWVTSRGEAPIAISTANPSLGAQHLRIPAAPPVGVTLNVYSTYFGPWPSGAYDFSADLAVSAAGGSNYFVLLRDGQRGGVLAGLVLAGNGGLFAYNPEQNNYTGIGRSWAPGVYGRYTMAIDPERRVVRYLIDREEAAVRPLVGGTGFGQVQIQRSASEGMDVLDVDNLVYQSFYRGLRWVRVPSAAGVVPPGEQVDIPLTFHAAEVEPGEYRAVATLRTNDPERPVLTAPITLRVTPVGAEDPSAELGTRLLGAYPNPARGEVRIGYAIARPSTVSLEVFTVTGRRVAVLAEGFHPAGPHEVSLDTRTLAAGLYVYRLRAGDAVETQRFTVVP